MSRKEREDHTGKDDAFTKGREGRLFFLDYFCRILLNQRFRHHSESFAMFQTEMSLKKAWMIHGII